MHRIVLSSVACPAAPNFSTVPHKTALFLRKKNYYSRKMLVLIFSTHLSDMFLILTYLHTYLLTYLLIPWCRVLLEKLTGLQLVKKFPTFHGTRRFITALTTVRHLSLSWASPIQSIYPHSTSWRSILILSTHLCLGLPSDLFPSVFPTKTLYTPILTHMCHMPSPSHSSGFYHPHKTHTRKNKARCLKCTHFIM